MDEARCVGHGRCYVLAPEVYEEDDRGHCVVLRPDVPPEHERGARLGAENCPEQAIAIVADADPPARPDATGSRPARPRR